jgi:hypothetical protein
VRRRTGERERERCVRRKNRRDRERCVEENRRERERGV